MADFFEIMDALSPKVIIEVCEIPHSNARGNYLVPGTLAEDYDSFLYVVIHYTTYHYKVTRGKNQLEIYPDLALGIAKNFLDKNGGWKNAVHMALSGSDGGLLTVLNRIAEGFIEEDRHNYFNYIIDNHINMLQFEERVKFMEQFRENVLLNFCPEIQYIPAVQMASPGQFESIIWNYMENLKRYRNLWQY